MVFYLYVDCSGTWTDVGETTGYGTSVQYSNDFELSNFDDEETIEQFIKQLKKHVFKKTWRKPKKIVPFLKNVDKVRIINRRQLYSKSGHLPRKIRKMKKAA